MGYSKSAPVGDILDDPAASAVVDRHLPGALALPMLRHLPLMSLESVTGALFAGQRQQDLTGMWDELAALDGQPRARGSQHAPAPAPTRIDTGDTQSKALVMGIGPPGRIEQWGVAELSLEGPPTDNPFTDVDLHATFVRDGHTPVTVGGFYDGQSVYRIRFQPSAAGEWQFTTASNATVLDGIRGSFHAAPPSPGNHGPVEVADTFHFAHRDGTRFAPLGTTAYAWTHQRAELEEQTLRTLADSPFQKVRMCVFPKSYLFNTEEPTRLPYKHGSDGWDFTRLDVGFFQHLERRILELQALGIETDLILFHTYDRWGFSQMPAWADDLYLRQLVCRLGAFRSVWWSLANEYDLLRNKTEADWERFAAIIGKEDHARHLTSIHNGLTFYDHSRPWITHCSIQRIDVYRTAENTDEWRLTYGKPVVVDECGYEGDIEQGWGNISGQELVRRAWEATVRGGYFTHGETYVNDREELWWSKGGEMTGTSPARLGFLRRIVAEVPGGALEPLPGDWDARWAGTDEHRLVYFGFGRPSRRTFVMPPGTEWAIDVVDTWNMTVDTLPEPHSGRFTVSLPGREYMAVRLRRRK
ncbi:DUF5605 domain-containing protein [Streptomyces sp. CA-179760]|uniref:DUF5605 domain-containing protein n=1 Tax=Streptomyces sp. CA-179760 TaxID=3240054 RepID=UPI003D8C5290